MMATATTLIPVGNWQAEVSGMLNRALGASVGICGRTGEEACRHALILMAQSARALAIKAKAKRPVLHDATLGPYVEIFKKDRSRMKSYKWQHPDEWENTKTIGNRGLAKRSWMWGLERIGGKSEGRAIAGTSKLYTITSEKANGYVKENRLDYIQKAMPAGWELTVATRATNKIMAQAARKVEAQFRAQGRTAARSVSSFFRQVAA